MVKIEVELDEQTLERAQKLAELRKCKLPELIALTIEQLAKPEVAADRILGSWANEAKLAEEVIEDIMQDRAKARFNISSNDGTN